MRRSWTITPPESCMVLGFLLLGSIVGWVVIIGWIIGIITAK